MNSKSVKEENSLIVDPSFPQDCVLGNDRRKIFAFSENNKTYRANNPEEKVGCMLQIDGKLIKSSDQKKCDNGLLVEDGRFFLIELKGVDVASACKQLTKTLDDLKQMYKAYSFDYYGRIVARKGVPMVNTERQRAEMQFRSTNKNKKLVIRENKYEEDI